MIETPVLIIGGGPVGLVASLLLSGLGVRSILADERPSTSSHPRARLYDRCTLELLRQLGVADEFEKTGLGADWTEYNRWFDSLSGSELCRVRSPSFHSVATASSPAVPVMSSQDLLEAILLRRARAETLADIRFGTRAEDLRQDVGGCSAVLRDVAGSGTTPVSATYVIAADGVRSHTRDVIDCPLSGDRLDVYFQDVLFHADLSRWADHRKAGLLFVAHPRTGGAVFQPLDGKTRWRCQIGNFPRDEEITDAFCIDWIKAAIGTAEDVAIEIESVNPWRFVAATAVRFANGRIFLAGDAAHAFIPAGGLGSNTGIVGIRNLAWKVAYVVRGVAAGSILDTYDEEHGRLAATRVRTSYENAMLAAGIFQAHESGGDIAQAAVDSEQYGDYEGLILGYEHSSSLCMAEIDAPPQVENAVRDYIPSVRCGRRAPHAWTTSDATHSTVDWFVAEYVVVSPDETSRDQWRAAVDRVKARGFPIRLERLTDTAGTAYADQQAVIVRPDGIVAGHVALDETTSATEFLERCLP